MSRVVLLGLRVVGLDCQTEMQRYEKLSNIGTNIFASLSLVADTGKLTDAEQECQPRSEPSTKPLRAQRASVGSVLLGLRLLDFG